MVSKEALTVDAKRTRAEVAVVKETILIYFFFDLIINKIKLKFRFYVKLKDENTWDKSCKIGVVPHTWNTIESFVFDIIFYLTYYGLLHLINPTSQ